MHKKAYIITDIGPGDGGKGGVVHTIATMLRAHHVIKRGGAQGSHGVRNRHGEEFAFSQYGCGTLEGIRTHISPGLIVSPEGLLNESELLRRSCSIADPWSLLTVDEDALCATEFHGIASRIIELSHGSSPRGTVGTGVGQAYRYSLSHPDMAIYVRDLGSRDLRDRLEASRVQILRDLDAIIHGDFLPEDMDEMRGQLAYLQNPASVEAIAQRFHLVTRLAHIVDPEYLGREILSRDGNVVVETSHGVLTDNQMGFAPHTSAIRTLPGFTRKVLTDAGYDGQIVDIACRRGYEVRHGAGPMPTADPKMSENLLPGSHKQDNRWQGRVRVGPIDLPLLRYSVSAAGGPQAFNGLALTWFDQIVENGEWHVCHRYASGTEDRRFFTEDGELRVRRGEGPDQRAYTQELGHQLTQVVPEITTIPIPRGLSREQLFHLVEDVLNEATGVELSMLSLGPTEIDKVAMLPKSLRT